MGLRWYDFIVSSFSRLYVMRTSSLLFISSCKNIRSIALLLLTFDPLSIYFGLVESKSKVNREILMITKRQKEVLDFVKSYKKKKDYAPSLEEIKKHLGLSSVSTAHHHVKKLQDAGYIYKGNN
ncbi:MAG: hypothetical protein HYU98_02830, partial [Deltaproteobacteria bacterium]|nr:hypothetical protein [Deltaproteobacteria bacterium]